jgi:lipid-A-disaccharide synthase
VGRRTVLVLTGEPSGDRAGGRLARELARLHRGIRIRAVGGPELREAGAEILQPIDELGAMGFVEVLRHIPRLRRLEARLARLLDEEPPDVVVPIDYPGFNLRIARAAKRRGIRVAYYIGPQVWAWGAGRVPKIARAVDRMIVVFPFEEEIYRRAGIRVDFVGHPLLDDLAAAPGRDVLRAALGASNGVPILGLLPGSRVQEVRRLLPVMLEAARLVKKGRPDLAIVASHAQGVPRAEYDRALADASGLDVHLRPGPAAAVITGSDALLVTSGTATLEAALLGTPLAVLYRTAPLTWLIGRRLVKIPRIALVNIVAGEDLAAEFLQGDARADRIAAHVEELIEPGERHRVLSEKLRALRGRLGREGASRRAAEIVLEEAGA